MRSIFTTPLGELSFHDISMFCRQKVPESTCVEYKKRLTEKVVEVIAAMANTDGGVILVGVEDDYSHKGLPGEIVGIDGKQSEQTILNWCFAYLDPPLCPEMKPYPLPEDPTKSVLLIRVDPQAVPEHPVIHREKGVLVRHGEENRPASRSQLKELFDLNRESEKWMQGDFGLVCPNLPNYCHLCMRVVFPKKRFTANKWISEHCENLQQAVSAHKLGNLFTWTARWYPVEAKESPKEEWKARRDTSLFLNLGHKSSSAFVDFRREGKERVRFYPVRSSLEGKNVAAGDKLIQDGRNETDPPPAN